MQEFVSVELEASYIIAEKWTYKLIIINEIKFKLNAFIIYKKFYFLTF